MKDTDLIDILAAKREITDDELIEMLQGMVDEIPDDSSLDSRFARLIIKTAIERLGNMKPQPIDEYTPRDGKPILLTVYVRLQKRIVIGAWDNSWSGKCWVYTDPRIPAGTIPTHWHPLPNTT